jgi:hypothetical protein
MTNGTWPCPLTNESQFLHIRSLKTEAKGGKKEAFLGGEVSEYIRANTTIKRRGCIITTSAIMIPRQEGM